ncbi:hypothetical protein CHARACLAT_007267 [Characodon lateralis]|uniref:Uncharacterized protein n=1 Tax=Characodon lateralis TaxID=208331 RepID=A0ABU7D8C3_9TELE|nr:hypothetical protein [Characodon lateralis]
MVYRKKISKTESQQLNVTPESSKQQTPPPAPLGKARGVPRPANEHMLLFQCLYLTLFCSTRPVLRPSLLLCRYNKG